MTKITKGKEIPILSAVVAIQKSELNDLGNDLMNRMQSGVILLSVIEGEKCQLFIKVSPDLVEKGIHANTLIKAIAEFIEGTGGGKKEMAQAGGKNPKGVIIAFDKIEEMLRE